MLVVVGCQQTTPEFDLVIRNGTVYDGLGGTPANVDIAVKGDRIVELADRVAGRGKTEIDAAGMAVAPGFINMLSWATESLIEDGRAMSDVYQGVTLEVMGEGWSMGPVNSDMREAMLKQQYYGPYEIEWTTLGEYLEYLQARGIAPNVASYVGAATVRMHEVGLEDRSATADELLRMQELVRQAMREGAIGVGSSLIYAPGNYADTAELVALVGAAAEYDGRYISHMRSEGDRLLESVEELIDISRRTGAPAEIYHLKVAGRQNWGKMDAVFELVESAQREGLAITADMYTYPAGATGLDAAMPLWVQEGGTEAWIERLQDASIRKRVVLEMESVDVDWENLALHAGAEGVLFAGFRNPELRAYVGKTLAQVAAERGTSPAETIVDLVIEDGSRVETIYFLMSEENIKRQLARPWVSFGSDAGALATEGVFLDYNSHPRAYGNFARVLGKYSRDEGVIPLREAIRRLTSLPASNIGIRQRGALLPGYFADIVVFDPETVSDHSTFEEPHQYSSGVRDVFVNGEAVLRDAEHTGATPGRVVRGPGWAGWD
ncbi:MAG: D-aminoacylase [Gammaproteobacteria bacterium]|nr:D-aminoacylase [Gammaproteobacteria bacterium]